MSFSKLLDRAKKNHNGFTLIELIVTLAIFSIVLVVAGNYLFFGNNLFVKIEVKNSEKYIGDNVFEYIQRRLTYATFVEIINPTSSKEPQYKNVIKLNDEGQLLMGLKGGDITNVFSPEFYDGGYKVSYEVQVLDSMRLELKVNVMGQGSDSPVYTTSEVLKILNFQDSVRGGSILTTDGEQKKIYVNPVISYQEDKEISATYDPIYIKDWMVDTAEKLMNGEDPQGVTAEEYKKMTNYGSLTPNNNAISSYVAQYHYKGKPYLSTNSPNDIYQYWEDFPGFNKDIIERTDAKVREITGYTGKKGDRLDQTLSNYLVWYKEKKVRAYISANTSVKKTSCFIYVITSAGQPWATRIVYCDVPGERGWYYLVALKGKEKTGAITDNYGVNDRIWKTSDGVPNSNGKTPVYDEIMNQAEKNGKKQEGIWVKVE